jgi:raffinose/stachyose/melibiose transport system substrate-binding protein
MHKKMLIAGLLTAISIALGAAQGEKATIRFFHRWPYEPRFTYYNQLVAEFEKQNPNITIKMDSVVNDAYKDKIRVLISSNEIPDVFCSWSDSFAYNLVKSGKIKVLNDMLAKDPALKNSLMQASLKSFTFGGKVYGLPQDANGKVFVYNKAIFSRAGIKKEPVTYDEFIADLNALRSKGYNVPLLEGLADTWAISHYLGSIFQRYMPAEVLDKDYAEATGEFTNSGYKVGLQRFQQLVSYMGPDATSINHDDALHQFTAGTLPVMYVEVVEFSYIRRTNPTLDYGFFNFPRFGDGKGDPDTLTGAPEGFMMSNSSKYPEAAEKFFKFIYSKENAYKFVKDTGVPMSIIGAVNVNNSYPKLIEAMNLINRSKSMTPWFDDAVNIKVGDAFMRGAQSMCTKEMTADQVMANVQAAAKIVRREAATQ